MIALPYLDIDTPFPPVSEALDDPNGLLAFGADLSAQRLFFLPILAEYFLGLAMMNPCCGGRPIHVLLSS